MNYIKIKICRSEGISMVEQGTVRKKIFFELLKVRSEVG